MEIESERILLRGWREEDAPMLYRFASDPDVGPRAGWLAHTTVDESREVIRTVFSNPTTWAIVLKSNGLPIGAMGYGPSCNLWIARPRRRADRRLLGGKAILGTRHLHRSTADDARPRSAHNRHSLVRQRAFCRQSGFGQGDGKMRFRANRRNLHIADPRHRLRPPDSRPPTMAVRYRL